MVTSSKANFFIVDHMDDHMDGLPMPRNSLEINLFSSTIERPLIACSYSLPLFTTKL